MGIDRAASPLSSRGLSRFTKTSAAAGLVTVAVAFGGVAVPAHADEIDDLFNLAFDENTVSWQLTGDTWTQVSRDSEGNPLTDLQEELIRRTRMRRK